MPRRSESDDEPGLFDLPLEPGAAAPREREARPPQPERQPLTRAAPRAGEAPAPSDALPLFTPAAAAAGAASPSPAPAKPTGPQPAPRRARLLAGLADLRVHAAVGVGAVAGAYVLGVRPQPADWPPFAILLLTFSFLYSVVPLAFWGQTLGMAWAGLVATGRDGEALTFEQTALRWLGGLLTCATLGLPLLFARRRSPADWLSGSVTVRRR